MSSTAAVGSDAALVLGLAAVERPGTVVAVSMAQPLVVEPTSCREDNFLCRSDIGAVTADVTAC